MAGNSARKNKSAFPLPQNKAETLRRLLYLLPLLLLPLLVWFVLRLPASAKLYKEPLVYVTHVENTLAEKQFGPAGEEEEIFRQNITARRVNGENIGEIVDLTNQFTPSGVYDEEVKIGNQIFIRDGESGLVIAGFRRDAEVAALLVLTIVAFIVFGKKRGLLALLSLAVNLICFALVVFGVSESIPLYLLMPPLILVFAALPLFFYMGKSRKTFVAILATMVSLALSVGLSVILLKATGMINIYPEGMDFSNIKIDIYQIFWAQLSVAGLGAVMDIAVTITSSAQELMDQNKGMSQSQLTKSCHVIGTDVMGTMVNVLFFTILAGNIPWLLVIAKNNINWIQFYTIYIGVDITRFITASYGIIIAISVSTFLSVRMLRRTDTNLPVGKTKATEVQL